MIFRAQKNIQKRTILDEKNLKKTFSNNTLLITGAGSISSAIIEELQKKIIFKLLIVIDNSELSLFNLRNKLKGRINIIYLLGTINDKIKLDNIFKRYNPEIVIHTAAYKHVDLLENDIYEAIKVNVEGTINLFKLSKKYKVNQFVFISTDKAVYPINNMGVTKKIAELYLESTIFRKKMFVKILRFGNVIESNGSFTSALKEYKNKTINLRGNNTTRYFIYKDVVAKSILNLLNIKTNGKFILEMSSPIKISSIVKYYNIDKKVKVIDLLQGEKENEDLLYKNEIITKTNYEIIFKIKYNKSNKHSYINDINELIKYNNRFDSKKLNEKLSYFKNEFKK